MIRGSSAIEVAIIGRAQTAFNKLWIDTRSDHDISEKIKFIYYKFNSNGNIISAATSFSKLIGVSGVGNFNSTTFYKLRKYLNTGIPAPDGYYYQQGDPKNMIYDPNNTNLIPKREIAKWKSSKIKKTTLIKLK